MAFLVTGAAGFIGHHVSRALRARGERVIGVDSITSYYEVRLKHDRLARLADDTGFVFHKGDVADARFMAELGAAYPEIEAVIHLAAQPGVRPGPIAPQVYVSTNLLGHLNVLELVRRLKRCRHLVYASSSSVYGAASVLPYREDDRADTPLSLYAATKRGDELLSHAYRGQMAVPQSGLRFFTVYGPWGRPDMAYFSFARRIRAGLPILLFDGGRLKRDFTFIDDIVKGLLICLDHPPSDAPDGKTPARVLNIGAHDSHKVSDLVAALELSLGIAAVIVDTPAPVTEVSETFADISALMSLGEPIRPTKLVDGIEQFVAWLSQWEGAARIAPRSQ